MYLGLENVGKVLGKFSDNEPAKKLRVQLLRMFIRRNHSESPESSKASQDSDHAGLDEKIIQVCGGPLAVQEEDKIK